MERDTSSVSQYDWEEMPSLCGLWHFQPSEDHEPDEFFTTEDEARARQRAYREAKEFPHALRY